MTLVISHGLDMAFSRYEEGLDDAEIRAGVVRLLVERGYSNLLREVVWREVGQMEGARVFEARRDGEQVTGRWLSTGEGAPMLERLSRLYAEHDTYVSFAYGGDIDEQGGIDAAEVNIVNDGATKLPAKLETGSSRSVQVWPLSACWLGRGDDRRVRSAWAYREIAAELRLVLAVA